MTWINRPRSVREQKEKMCCHTCGGSPELGGSGADVDAGMDADMGADTDADADADADADRRQLRGGRS